MYREEYRIVRNIKPSGEPLGKRPIIKSEITKVRGTPQEGVFRTLPKDTKLETAQIFSALKNPPLYNCSTWKSSFVRDHEHYDGILSKKDKMQGCLIGCAIGDAFGVPFERRKRDEILAILSQYLSESHLIKFPDPKELPWIPYKNKSQKWREVLGQYSDDTQLMTLVYETVLENKGEFCPELYSEKLMEKRDCPTGFGKGTLESIDRLIEGVSWKASGSPSPSCGNGAAMKAACFGVLFENKKEALRACIESSLPTHQSDESLAGAFVIASTSSHLYHLPLGLSLDPLSLLDNVIEDIEGYHNETAEDIKTLRLMIESEIPKESILRWIISKYPPSGNWQLISPYVKPTVLWALTCFLLEDTLAGVLRSALSCGGDVDTTAAIACSLFGCYNGFRSLPFMLKTKIHDRGKGTYLDLMRLSNKTYKVLKGE